MKCNKTLSKWCKNKHGASKIIDTFETYQGAPLHATRCTRYRRDDPPGSSYGMPRDLLRRRPTMRRRRSRRRSGSRSRRSCSRRRGRGGWSTGRRAVAVALPPPRRSDRHARPCVGGGALAGRGGWSTGNCKRQAAGGRPR
jgi:hypothetical protein